MGHRWNFLIWTFLPGSRLPRKTFSSKARMHLFKLDPRNQWLCHLEVKLPSWWKQKTWKHWKALMSYRRVQLILTGISFWNCNYMNHNTSLSDYLSILVFPALNTSSLFIEQSAVFPRWAFKCELILVFNSSIKADSSQLSVASVCSGSFRCCLCRWSREIHDPWVLMPLEDLAQRGWISSDCKEGDHIYVIFISILYLHRYYDYKGRLVWFTGKAPRLSDIRQRWIMQKFTYICHISCVCIIKS